MGDRLRLRYAIPAALDGSGYCTRLRLLGAAIFGFMGAYPGVEKDDGLPGLMVRRMPADDRNGSDSEYLAASHNESASLKQPT
jgi:hypothetical protein